mmetsp:Transcript_15699/g.20373  ORF Transcript_15699/g.20373 Transcript_15699/m.20373 type:complete len:436 (+) Transcript_15699:281-1588(+)
MVDNDETRKALLYIAQSHIRAAHIAKARNIHRIDNNNNVIDRQKQKKLNTTIQEDDENDYNNNNNNNNNNNAGEDNGGIGNWMMDSVLGGRVQLSDRNDSNEKKQNSNNQKKRTAVSEFLALEGMLKKLGSAPLRGPPASLATSTPTQHSILSQSNLYNSILEEPHSFSSSSSSSSSSSFNHNLPLDQTLYTSIEKEDETPHALDALSSSAMLHASAKSKVLQIKAKQSNNRQPSSSNKQNETFDTNSVTTIQEQEKSQTGTNKTGGRFISNEEYIAQQQTLMRYLKTTQVLHDENANLLEEREKYQRIERESEIAKSSMESFRTEYSRLLEKVKDEMLKFRASHPHPDNPTSVVPSPIENQLKKLAETYERKSQKLTRTLNDVANAYKKQTIQLEKTERNRKKLELKLQVLIERANAKARSKQGQTALNSPVTS